MNVSTEIAIDKVRDNNKDYYLKALAFAKSFVSVQMKPFSSENIIESYYIENEKPRESRVWGAVMRELKKENLIFFHGYQTYRNPKGHSKPSNVWISKEYSDKQKSNRTLNSKTQVKLDL